jgi:hypothetical protein
VDDQMRTTAHGTGPARRLTSAERLHLKQRVRARATHAEAAHAVGCSEKTVQRVLRQTGGVRTRTSFHSKLHLSLAEREAISRGLVAGASCRQMAAKLGRAILITTVTRNEAANGSRAHSRACRADEWPRRDGVGQRPGSFGSAPVSVRRSSTAFAVAGRRNKLPRDLSTTTQSIPRCGCRAGQSTNLSSYNGAVNVWRSRRQTDFFDPICRVRPELGASQVSTKSGQLQPKLIAHLARFGNIEEK